MPHGRHSKDNPKLENGGDLYITLSSGSVAARRAALAAYRPSDEFIYSEAGGAEAAEVCWWLCGRGGGWCVRDRVVRLVLCSLC